MRAKNLERAADLAEQVNDVALASRIRLDILERIAAAGGDYNVSVPLCAAALRTVRRSGDRLVLAEAHVAFARLEARMGRVHLARRHISLVSNLLKERPNLWLDASARLTNAIVFSVQGDLQTACELAESAARDASEAGWLKGEAIAAANLAYFHACAGHIDLAKHYIAVSKEIGYLPPSYACALLDTETIVAFADGDYEQADRLWHEGRESVSRVAYWYWLRCAHTRVRGLIQQGRLQEALELARKHHGEANELRNDYFSFVFGLSVAQIDSTDLSHFPLHLGGPSDSSLGLIGARRQVLAKALREIGSSRADLEAAAAYRILESAGSRLEWGAFENPGGGPRPVAASLDDARRLHRARRLPPRPRA